MRNQTHEPRRSRTSRLEFCESRQLQSTVSAPLARTVEVSPMAKAHGETIKGSMSGTCSLSGSSSMSGVFQHESINSTVGTGIFVATGSLTILGQASLTGSDSYSLSHHEAKYTHGSVTVSDTGGDQITASFEGSGKASTTGKDTFKVRGPVTGGAGTYAGAAGKFSASGSFNSQTDEFSIKLTIKLDQPGHHRGNKH